MPTTRNLVTIRASEPPIRAILVASRPGYDSSDWVLSALLVGTEIYSGVVCEV